MSNESKSDDDSHYVTLPNKNTRKMSFKSSTLNNEGENSIEMQVFDSSSSTNTDIKCPLPHKEVSEQTVCLKKSKLSPIYHQPVHVLHTRNQSHPVFISISRNSYKRSMCSIPFRRLAKTNDHSDVIKKQCEVILTECKNNSESSIVCNIPVESSKCFADSQPLMTAENENDVISDKKRRSKQLYTNITEKSTYGFNSLDSKKQLK